MFRRCPGHFLTSYFLIPWNRSVVIHEFPQVLIKATLTCIGNLLANCLNSWGKSGSIAKLVGRPRTGTFLLKNAGQGSGMSLNKSFKMFFWRISEGPLIRHSRRCHSLGGRIRVFPTRLLRNINIRSPGNLSTRAMRRGCARIR